ncbi:MAG: type II toxin-antitoxin system RelE/ParE family toxin [Deltaproteobacteria bacterium]|nr:type II toxin-antitoxin system RelE/ParE family toxin [Deltaproteobacteria bacterium]
MEARRRGPKGLSILPVRYTLRAEREILKQLRWWEENRDKAPDALREELTRAERLIASQPNIVGQRAPRGRLSQVRRLPLDRVRFHLYYQVSDDGTAVWVLSLWHYSRRRGPRL